jgi:putative oxidoreductase
MRLKFLGRFREEGLLLLRVGIGVMFLFHGWPKLLGGPAKWESIGHAVSYLGITAWPTLWGLLAGLSEFGGGICLILGFLFRPACLLLMVTMGVAANSHLARGEGLMGASHAIELGIVFFGLALIGSGRYSLDRS